jgi:hypothetical protein
MKTAVLVDSGYAGSSRHTFPLVLEPACKACRAVTREPRAGGGGPARKPKRVVVPFSVSTPRLEASDARMQVPKPGVWAWLELGFVMVLIASASFLILLSVVGTGNL